MANSKAKGKVKGKTGAPAPRKAAKAAKSVTAKKATAKKPAVKAKIAPVKKAAKPAAGKSAVKKPAAKKVIAKKPAAKKAAPPKAAARAAAKPLLVKSPQAKPEKKAAVPAKKTAPAKPAPVVIPPQKVAAAPAASSKSSVRSNPSQSNEGNTARAVKKSVDADNGVTMQDGRYVLPASVTIALPKGYKPSAKEEYMEPRHLQYFRDKLSNWRAELVEESRQTIESLRDEVRDVGDEAERATRETENSLELRTRDRYRKLIAKIDKALKRIEEGRYGFCEETDEEIGIERLEARPIATLSLDAQERWEHRQKQMGD